MIVQLVVTWFADAAVWLFNLFPDWTPPSASSWANAAGSVWTFTGWLNNYVPLDVALGILTLLVTIWLGNFVLRVTIWVFTKLHFLGGAD